MEIYEGVCSAVPTEVIHFEFVSGDIPADLERRLIEAKDLELLKSWIKLAVDSGSFEKFQQKTLLVKND